MMQMYMQWGTYGGERYIEEAALKEFARCQYCEEGNRRGLGFDKPLIENKYFLSKSRKNLLFFLLNILHLKHTIA